MAAKSVDGPQVPAAFPPIVGPRHKFSLSTNFEAAMPERQAERKAGASSPAASAEQILKVCLGDEGSGMQLPRERHAVA